MPPILLGLSKAPIVDNYDLSSIKSLMSAAAPLTKEIVHAVWKRLKIPVKQAYGLSETSPGTHVQVNFFPTRLKYKNTNSLPREPKSGKQQLAPLDGSSQTKQQNSPTKQARPFR